MKVTIIKCDLCNNSISPPESAVILPTRNRSTKQIGCDMVLTPPGKRLHALNGKAMIRMNASFYVSVVPKDVEELHFHNDCLEHEVHERMQAFYADRG